MLDLTPTQRAALTAQAAAYAARRDALLGEANAAQGALLAIQALLAPDEVPAVPALGPDLPPDGVGVAVPTPPPGGLTPDA